MSACVVLLRPFSVHGRHRVTATAATSALALSMRSPRRSALCWRCYLSPVQIVQSVTPLHLFVVRFLRCSAMSQRGGPMGDGYHHRSNLQARQQAVQGQPPRASRIARTEAKTDTPAPTAQSHVAIKHATASNPTPRQADAHQPRQAAAAQQARGGDAAEEGGQQQRARRASSRSCRCRRPSTRRRCSA